MNDSTFGRPLTYLDHPPSAKPTSFQELGERDQSARVEYVVVLQRCNVIVVLELDQLVDVFYRLCALVPFLPQPYAHLLGHAVNFGHHGNLLTLFLVVVSGLVDAERIHPESHYLVAFPETLKRLQEVRLQHQR